MSVGAADRKGAQLRMGAVALAATLILLAIASSAPAAEPVIIGEEGAGAGQYANPMAAAVKQSSGDVYLVDRNNFRIDKFGSDGSFLLAWGRGVADGDIEAFQTCGPEATPPTLKCFPSRFNPDGNLPGETPEGLAVDQATGDVYTLANLPATRIEKFTATGEFLLMFGKDVNVTPGTPHPNLCTADDLAAGDTCARGTTADEPGALYFPLSVTVAQDGKVWVSSFEKVQVFNSDGTLDREVALPGQKQIAALAIDSSGDIFATGSRGGEFESVPRAFDGVRKFDGVTGAFIEGFDEGGNAQTLTIDSSDNLYVGDGTDPYRYMIFNSSGEQTAQFGAGQVLGKPGGHPLGVHFNAIAVDESNRWLYSPGGLAKPEALQRFSIPEPGPLPLGERAENVLPTTATLAATLNAEGDETTYFFEYGTDTGYGTATPTTTLPGTGFDDQPVQSAIDHLIPNTTYHFRLVASNHCNPAEPTEVCTVEGEDRTFTTPPAVLIEPQWSTHVTSNSATLNAELDPLGAGASWWLEYGTDGSYGSVTPEAQIPGTFGPIQVHTDLLGLVGDTTYHYRFVARDERDGSVYTVYGEDHSFTTQLSGLDFRLADRRAWEMVTPAEKFGASVVNPNQGVTQAAADGSGFAYQTVQSIEANPDGSRALDFAHAIARRDAGSWSSKDITPQFTEVTSVLFGGEYKLFSPDLARAVLEARDATPLSPEASERTPYLRENFTDPVRFRPLVTSKPPYANVPPGTVFGQTGSGSGKPDLRIEGASPDARHVLISSLPALATGAPSDGSRRTLYLWGDGLLHTVSELPDDEGGEIVFGRGGAGQTSVRHAVSDDGSRVFWTTIADDLYVRDVVADESARIGPSGSLFQGASTDGRFAFFTAGDRDLYRCELPSGSITGGCVSLIKITAPGGGSEETGRALGIAPAISEDGTTIYFVARGVLDTTPNISGETPVAGEPNLYVWQEGDPVRFVSRLSSKDNRDWGVSPTGGPGRTAILTAAGSPSGRYLTFMSERPLTGYDNRDAVTAEPLPEVFRYDLAADSLVCVSCKPTGGRPIGELTDGGVQTPKDPDSRWPDTQITALIPYPRESEPVDGLALYEARRVLDNGRVYFNALDPLVPADSNGQWDVYQYEPTGIGDCTASSGGAATARQPGGCVSLISSGSGEDEAVFLDASANGDDVFFLTSSRLSVLDEDSEFDIYDARVDGVTAALTPPVECRGESCQPAIAAPNDPTPTSSSFRGAGNLKEKAGKKRCPKGKHRVIRKGKPRCVKKKGKGGQQGARHSGRAGR